VVVVVVVVVVVISNFSFLCQKNVTDQFSYSTTSNLPATDCKWAV
jgi:hypothetical protein